MLIPNEFGNIGLLLVRVAIAAVFIYHGLPKLRNSAALAKGMGFPAAGVMLIGLVETLGGLGALLGFLTQIAAIGLVIVMLGALYHKLAKWNVPFSAHDKMGWEFDLILLAAAIVLATLGAGSFSVDASVGLWP